MKKLNNENAYAILETGKTYKFADYDWTVCELVNNGKTAVIQSHGVTHGVWPGYVIPQFGNGNFYEKSIDGEDISGYDDKLKELYNAIKDVEDKSATYGKGLYLVSKGKAGFAKWGQPGSGNYWQALKKASENVRSFGSPNSYAWLGTVNGGNSAWCVNSGGNVYGNYGQDVDYVVAPAFNIDLSKVEIRDDKIVIRDGEKTQTSQTFEITLIEKPNVDGLTKAEVMEMYDQMNGDEAYPLEITGCETSAMGFITLEAAKILDYDYEDSGLKDFVSVILGNVNNEPEDGTYEFRGIRIHLSR